MDRIKQLRESGIEISPAIEKIIQNEIEIAVLNNTKDSIIKVQKYLKEKGLHLGYKNNIIQEISGILSEHLNK